MSLESFLNSVEKALKSGQLTPREAEIARQQAQLSPNERKIKRGSNLKKIAKTAKPSPLIKVGNTALKAPTAALSEVSEAGGRGMRTVYGSARTVGDDVLKLTGEAAKKAPKGAVLKGLGKVAVPLAAAEQAYQTAKLIGSAEARREAEQDYADSADEGALLRTVKGGLGGVTTIYGALNALNELDKASVAARDSRKNLEEKMSDPRNQQLVSSAQERQAIFMSLPQEEQDLVDSMSGKEAKLYLEAKMKKPQASLQDAPMRDAPMREIPEPAPASSEPEPPSSPATAGAQRSSMERQMTALDAQAAAAPRAIPVPEPVDEDRAMALFQNTHGGPFDPKSSMDRGKMAIIQNLMAQKGSENLTPNQFSLKIYRMSK